MMRWYRTVTLVLLALLLSLIAIPVVRWFQTRKEFVQASSPEEGVEWAYSVAPAPKAILLPRIVPARRFNSAEPVEAYLVDKEMLAQMEPHRIEGTGHYDLRPYLADAGLAIPEEAVAIWDLSSGMALLKLPGPILEDARLLVGPGIDEWKDPHLELRATLLAVERGPSAEFLLDLQDLNLKWLTSRPPEKVEFLHSIAARSRSGQRAKSVTGEPGRESEDTTPGNSVSLEMDPVLGRDSLTIDFNLAYRFHRNNSNDPLNFEVATQVTIVDGYSIVLELGTDRGSDDGEGLTAYYLILQAARVSSRGRRADPSQ